MTVSHSPAQLGAMNTNKAAQPARETEMPSKTWEFTGEVNDFNSVKRVP